MRGLLSWSALVARYRFSSLRGPVLWERRAEALCAGLAVLLLLLLLGGAVSALGFGGVRAVPPSDELLQVGVLEGAAEMTAGDREQLLGRPLFWQSRRPVVTEPKAAVADKPKAAAAPKVEPLKGVELIGVFGSQEALGLIARVDGKVVRISPGQTVKGWQMAGYANGEARFTQGKQVRSLALALTTPNVRVSSGAEDAPVVDSGPDTGSMIGFGGSNTSSKRKR